MTIEHRTALVTGASSGIGHALCLWLAARGVKVHAAARRVELLEDLAKKHGSSNISGGGAIVPVALDVANVEETTKRIRELDDATGGLDLVVANAGIGEDTPAYRFKWESFARIVQVNVLGAAATLTAAMPKMIERKRGHLVGISSIASFRGLPRMAGYSASKAFLTNFLECLRLDLNPLGITVTCVQPGFVRSEMTDKNKFKMPFFLETEEAVSLIGEAIQRGDSTLTFPWQMAALMKSVRVMPDALYDAAIRKMNPKRP